MTADERIGHPLVHALRSRDAGLADQAAGLIRQSPRLLEYTISTFPSGTDHTHRHTRTVEKIARMVLSDEFLVEMTSEELLFLAVACHYHDLAMAGTETDDRTAESRDQVRRDHAVRIGDIVRERWAELGFENQRTAVVLGEVCRGHRPKKNAEGEANWDELSATEVLGPGISVRVRLLAALIYAIDELHLGADRAPERVQNWRNIQDDESRRHWYRHQAINGPVQSPPGFLLFQVSADTPQFEENLRLQVFRKAISAFSDLRRQAVSEGVTIPLPSIRIQWQRQVMWELLLPVVCSDMRPRNRAEIVQAIHCRFRQETVARVALDACTESGNTDEEIDTSIRRAVDDAVTKRRLVATSQPEHEYVLSGLPADADIFFENSKKADELDLLFVGRYRNSWEKELFASEFGRAYVRDSVFPAVEGGYSVRLTQRPANDPVRLLLESFPTAARLVRDYHPSPDNLVKDSLLSQVAVTGALIELHSDPERLLDGAIRGAIRTLIADNRTVATTVRLLEELALLGGFTYEQLSAAACPSEAAQAVMEKQLPVTGNSISIHLSQSLPSGASRAKHLHRLLLASQRAGTPILLTAAAEHDLTLRFEGNTDLANRDNTGVTVGIGPMASPLPVSFQLPAHVEVSRQTRTIRLLLGQFSADRPTAYPVVVILPAPPPPGQRPRATFSSSVQWPELTVRDWRALEAANQLARSGGARIELIIEKGDRLLGIMECPKGATLFGIWPGSENIQRALRGLDGTSPAPIHVTPDAIAEIANSSAAERERRWREERDYGSNPMRRVSSVFLRLSMPDGRPFEEQFLRFFPFSFFPAPDFENGDKVGIEELKRQWTEGENDFLITSFFNTDIHDLALELRKWCKKPQGEFPFRFQSGGIPDPVTRSTVTVRLLQKRERLWHVDRPIIFDFRPVNRKEAYEMESKYWRSVGDELRAKLAQEICERET